MNGSAALFELVPGRRGHYRLESGHHSGLWLDLDALFAVRRRIEPGPLVGGAFLAQLVAGPGGGVLVHRGLSSRP